MADTQTPREKVVRLAEYVAARTPEVTGQLSLFEEAPAAWAPRPAARKLNSRAVEHRKRMLRHLRSAASR